VAGIEAKPQTEKEKTMAKQDICVELVEFVKIVAGLETVDEGKFDDMWNVLDDLIANARSLLEKFNLPKDDRIIVHYEAWADGTLKTGAQVFRSIGEMRRKFPEAKYRLVERPIATRRGSAMMGGKK
jgi:hypothetical protein